MENSLRDPNNLCWSNYNHARSLDFLIENLANFYNLYLELMVFWKSFKKIYDISYENLTKNQEKETRKLLKYCDLGWDKNCLEFP